MDKELKSKFIIRVCLIEGENLREGIWRNLKGKFDSLDIRMDSKRKRKSL